jgi:hypothetical protein
MIGTPDTTSDTATVPVGFGAAAGIPPNAPHVPTETIAAAPRAASSRSWIADFPAIVQ